MKDPGFYENSLFIPALVVSAVAHGLLIGAGAWIFSAPYASVFKAPNSLEITVVSQPVVSVITEEIVSQEIADGNGPEEVFASVQAASVLSGRNNQPSVASRESLGAVTKAEPLTHINPAPPYPRIARQREWEGIVRLEVLVDKEGLPGSVVIKDSSGHEILDEAALTTVRGWKFSPARSGSTRFSSRITIPIQFALVREQ